MENDWVQINISTIFGSGFYGYRMGKIACCTPWRRPVWSNLKPGPHRPQGAAGLGLSVKIRDVFCLTESRLSLQSEFALWWDVVVSICPTDIVMCFLGTLRTAREERLYLPAWREFTFLLLRQNKSNKRKGDFFPKAPPEKK